MATKGQMLKTPSEQAFSAKTFDFLKGLSENQFRDWFTAHRPDSEAFCKGPMEALVRSPIPAMAAKDLEFTGDPARSIFRIHRDVRFSKDKRPYKAHIGAALTRDADKMSQACQNQCQFLRALRTPGSVSDGPLSPSAQSNKVFLLLFLQKKKTLSFLKRLLSHAPATPENRSGQSEKPHRYAATTTGGLRWFSRHR